MNPVLKEIYKLHPQASVGGAVLLAIRGRIEQKREVKNRIGGTFPVAKSLLIFGQPGNGKTMMLENIFHNLLGGLEIQPNHMVNDNGDLIAVYHASAGCSTPVGTREMLRRYGDAVQFFDEMSFNTTKHMHLLKQICNGQISWQKQGEIEAFEFNGLIIGATNGIKPPPAAEIEDFLATMDRFWIVEARGAELSPSQYFDAVLKYKERAKDAEPNWEALATAIGNGCYADLSEKEMKFTEELWDEKCREILDGGQRAQYRNVNNAIDIVTFVKRICQLEDLTSCKEAMSFARVMINDLIHFNPAPLFSMTPAERSVYNTISKNPRGSVTTQEILMNCRTATSDRNVWRIINKLMDLGLVYKTAHGRYTCKLGEAEAELQKTKKQAKTSKTKTKKKARTALAASL